MNEMMTGVTDRTSIWERIAFGSGMIFVVLLLGAAFITSMPPGADGTAAENVRWFAENQDAALVQVSVRGIAAIFQLIFVAALVNVVRRVQGSFDILTLLAFGGGIAHTLMLLVSNATSATAAVLADDSDIAPGVIRALQSLGENVLFLEAMAGALLVGSASIAILRTGVAPRWVGWLGVALMPVYLVGSFGFEDSPVMAIAFLALFGEMLWFFMSSLTLVVRTREGRATREARLATA